MKPLRLLAASAAAVSWCLCGTLLAFGQSAPPPEQQGTANVPLSSQPEVGINPVPPPSFPNPTEGPAWLLMEKGKASYRDKDFGTALMYFRAAINSGGETPEADMWIGRIFEEEGELDLAEDQLNRAYANRQQFVVPGDATEILYDLARIYQNTNAYGKYEVTLKQIVADDTQFSDPADDAMRQSMVRILNSEGLDKLLLLYRLRDKATLQAHSDLGIFYYRTGRYSDSILNLVFSVVTIFTTITDSYSQADPDWEFTTATNVVAMAATRTNIQQYIASTALYQDLYYLAAAEYAAKNAQRATQIWRLLVQWAPTDTWGRRAAQQLKSPTIEPVLGPGA